jgi:hypothetical protein
MFEKAKNYLNKHPTIKGAVKVVLKGSQVIVLDYPINPKPRYGYENPPHKKLYELINYERRNYQKTLKSFLKYKKNFFNIEKCETEDKSKPNWINPWFTGSDAIALYGFVREIKPKRYFEVGSGNSTKFVKQAVIDGRLNTKIVSIDPCPRTEIDKICDKVIRKPVEEANLKIFDELESGDILFIDNSHRAFTNSDVTVTFLDILPRLKRGVLVEFHDITLPIDYPIEWKHAYNSEQYLLACYILAEGKKFDIILPNSFISRDSKLTKILDPILKDKRMHGVESGGGSFWIRMN